MEEATKQSIVVRHVSFTPEEDQVIQEFAHQAEMSVCGYIRHQAIYGAVQSIDWERLQKHTEAIHYIAEEIKVYTSDKNPNPWLFAADLELINQKLLEIKELESRLISEICKGS